ncbi:MAG: hypothetical protein EB027_03590 [Actinobacteria bacterium]|nr:hypothetical protein [Actinomycetota bacterium]
MSTASVTAAGSLLMVAAAAFAVAALLTPAPLAPRILPWVEPGWRLQPSRLRGTQITVASFRVASRRHVPEACAAAMVFVCACALTGSALVACTAALTVTAGAVQLRQSMRDKKQKRTAIGIAAEVPIFADFLAVCVSSGVSVEAALARATGYLRGHIASALADVTSESLRSKSEGSDSAKINMDALAQDVAPTVDFAAQPALSGLERLSTLAGRSACAPLRQLVDAVNTSAALGTPLADVLFAQAQQLRAVHQQQLLAISGKREVLMLIPIVFVIFPVVVAVALFPAWAQLNGSVW